jgi:hypothetical protein
MPSLTGYPSGVLGTSYWVPPLLLKEELVERYPKLHLTSKLLVLVSVGRVVTCKIVTRHATSFRVATLKIPAALH